jgi:hypothetical protein
MSESTLHGRATKRKATEQRRDLRQRCEELGREVDAWLADESDSGEPSFVHVRKMLSGATLKFAQQWATECNLPTVRRGAAILARRAEAEQAIQFSAAKTAAAAELCLLSAREQ